MKSNQFLQIFLPIFVIFVIHPAHFLPISPEPNSDLTEQILKGSEKLDVSAELVVEKRIDSKSELKSLNKSVTNETNLTKNQTVVASSNDTNIKARSLNTDSTASVLSTAAVPVNETTANVSASLNNTLSNFTKQANELSNNLVNALNFKISNLSSNSTTVAPNGLSNSTALAPNGLSNSTAVAPNGLSNSTALAPNGLSNSTVTPEKNSTSSTKAAATEILDENETEETGDDKLIKHDEKELVDNEQIGGDDVNELKEEENALEKEDQNHLKNNENLETEDPGILDEQEVVKEDELEDAWIEKAKESEQKADRLELKDDKFEQKKESGINVNPSNTSESLQDFINWSFYNLVLTYFIIQ